MRKQFPFNDMKVGTTYGAIGDADEDFAGSGLWCGIVLENQRIGFDGRGGVEDAGFHGRGDTPGVLYGCETKGVAGRGICKLKKTKDAQVEVARGAWTFVGIECGGIHPPLFGKRGCKLLKTRHAAVKKRGKSAKGRQTQLDPRLILRTPGDRVSWTAWLLKDRVDE